MKGDEQGIIKLLDKVLGTAWFPDDLPEAFAVPSGGDARFTMVPGQKLPAWAQREAPAGKKAPSVSALLRGFAVG